MNLLHPADQRGADQRGIARSTNPRRRSCPGLGASLPDRSDRVRQHSRPEQPRRAIKTFAAQLRHARGAEHPTTHDVSGESPQSESGTENLTAEDAESAEMKEKQFQKISANSAVNTEVSPLGYPTELFAGEQTFESVNATISSIALQDRQPRAWLLGFLIACGLLGLFFVAVTWLLIRGVGIWGINIPVAWAFAIINFVWWIGLAHAGTFVSAMLLLMFQHWRSAINRFAESMTLFAIVCAGIFPILHLGRPWVFYWVLPYPDTMGMWPQFRSPLVWDAFAIGVYSVVSVLFWFLGLLPDLATVRDRARKHWQKNFYGVLALGWRNSAAHWHQHQTAYLLLAGLATPLVLSVHTIVSLDFAIAHVPGWHSTMFPPYFVAGAIYSGLAMVLTIVVPIRNVYRLENLITLRHFNNMANVMLAAGLIVAYGYFIEAFMAFL